MKPGCCAVGQVTLDRKLEAEDALVTDGTPLTSSRVIPGDDAIDPGELTSRDARPNAIEFVVHANVESKMVATTLALVLLILPKTSGRDWDATSPGLPGPMRLAMESRGAVTECLSVEARA
jgi:hypothetical protein